MPPTHSTATDPVARPWRRHDDPPAALYVHLPFCRRLCPYCDFAIARYAGQRAESYLHALGKELEKIGEGLPVETVYLGGGTPSILAAGEIELLFALLSRTVRLASVGEFSVECNPADVTPEKVGLLLDLGVNRFSLGAQSFHDETLRTLGRDHDGAAAKAAAEALLGSGAVSVSVDLIFGVPGTSAADFLRDLETALALGVHHVSLYGLTYEPGTRMTRWRDTGQITPLAEPVETEMYERAIQRLQEAGFSHYEISNFARSGHESRHNRTYWQGEPYHAAGLGATSYVGGVRAVRERRLHAYLRLVQSGAAPVIETHRLADEARARERLAFALRLVAGIPAGAFARAEGIAPLALAGEQLRRFAAQGLLELTEERIRLTRRGLLVADSVMAELI